MYSVRTMNGCVIYWIIYYIAIIVFDNDRDSIGESIVFQHHARRNQC